MFSPVDEDWGVVLYRAVHQRLHYTSVFLCALCEPAIIMPAFRPRGGALSADDSLSRLEEFVGVMMDMERIGGRFSRVGGDRLELYDCLCWPHEASERVQRCFPDVAIDVRSCRHSISGFAVVFVWTCRGGHEMMWCLAIAAALTGCAYVLVTSPWWGAYRWIQSI